MFCLISFRYPSSKCTPCFTALFCFAVKESNLNEGRLVNVHTVLPDCDTHPPYVVFCYFIFSNTNIELLIHR